MNVGIIVYSETGNTLIVAQRLKGALEAKGHSAAVEQVTIEGKVERGKPINLKSRPDAAKYDALIFASPVMAFSLNPVMKAYLSGLSGLKGKTAGCFVTQGLPADWMGGNQAIKHISSALKDKGAGICGSGIIHWRNEAKREVQAAKAVETLCGVF